MWTWDIFELSPFPSLSLENSQCPSSYNLRKIGKCFIIYLLPLLSSEKSHRRNVFIYRQCENFFYGTIPHYIPSFTQYRECGKMCFDCFSFLIREFTQEIGCMMTRNVRDLSPHFLRRVHRSHTGERLPAWSEHGTSLAMRLYPSDVGWFSL